MSPAFRDSPVDITFFKSLYPFASAKEIAPLIDSLSVLQSDKQFWQFLF